MNTSIHITSGFLGLVLCACVASPAAAQDWQDRGYFNFSLGGQAQDQTFNDNSTFVIYGEQGAVATTHVYGGGMLVDLSAGGRVWRNLALGIGYSSVRNENDAEISVRVPNPIFFNQSRTATATATDLSHSENVIHLHAGWMIPLNDRFQVMFFFGPSFFRVRQEIATVRVPGDLGPEVPPFTSITVNPTVAQIKDSPVGMNVGFDGTYLLRPKVGVGLFVRYAGASMDLPNEPNVTREGDTSVGGTQVGIGLRLRF